MEKYQKPIVEVENETCEGVYAASGANLKCRFGRTEANPGSDMCQGCSKSGGTSNDGSGAFKGDFKGCPDNMPVKE